MSSNRSLAEVAHSTDIKFATMLEELTEAVKKFHSAFRDSLNAADDLTRLGSNDKWLEYLDSLTSAAETTTNAMELEKKHLHSLNNTLGTNKTIALEKNDLSYHEA